MFRFAFYLGGLVAGVAALAFWQDYRRSTRRIPVKEAAAQLQAAWADYHTRA
jgi:hypothetical protein